MALMLPGELRTALEYIGYSWPATNEDALRQWGDNIREMSTSARDSVGDFEAAIAHVRSHNEGEALLAFLNDIQSQESNLACLEDFADSCDSIATGCDVCADIVVTMKVAVIFQLGILAVSLLSGPGALVVRQGVKWAIEAAINLVVDRVLNG